MSVSLPYVVLNGDFLREMYTIVGRDLTAQESLVLLYLLSQADEKGKTNLKAIDIARHLGLNVRTCQLAVRNLASLTLLKRKGKGTLCVHLAMLFAGCEELDVWQ